MNPRSARVYKRGNAESSNDEAVFHANSDGDAAADNEASRATKLSTKGQACKPNIVSNILV